MIILNDTEGILVIFHLLLQAFGIPFRHPAAENIEIVIIMLCKSCKLSHIIVGGKRGNPVPGSGQFLLPAAYIFLYLPLDLVNLTLPLPYPAVQHMACLHRSSLIFVRQVAPLKMHRRIDSVNLIRQLLRHKVNDPHIIRFFLTFKHHRIDGVIDEG